MVAGDTKRVVVIKNISSNLIEEAILILKSGTEGAQENRKGQPAQDKPNIRNDFILKEAEHIINDYINGNKLAKTRDRRRGRSWSLPHKRVLLNIGINILLMAAIALLIYVVGNAI
ncbi:MAG TPA: hypothetical protein VHT96_06970 [Clostridia bacterium]|nr:hypothetical protein [Clostridia bacterium]